jgi:ATP-dependent Lon protease
MEIIRIAGYTELEKLNIAKRYLVKKQREANGLAESNIEFVDSGRCSASSGTTRRSRRPETRARDRVGLSEGAVEVVKKDRNAKVKVTPKILTKLLGPPRYRYGKADDEQKVGVATGLAWTDLGGELLGTEGHRDAGQGQV